MKIFLSFYFVFLSENRSPQDNPLRQWADDHRETYLAEMLRNEGRGDHTDGPCSRCTHGPADHRCVNCLNGGELVCTECMVAAHQYLPFHGIEVRLDVMS